MQNLLILGAGGFGRTVAEVAAVCGEYGRIAFLDDNATHLPEVLAKCGAYRREEICAEFTCAYAAFGDNALRFAWLRALDEAGYEVPSFLHPRAFISPSAEIGQGSVVLPHAVVSAGATVGAGSLINIGALIDHDAILGVCSHIAPGAIIRANAIVQPQQKIESGTIVFRQP